MDASRRLNANTATTDCRNTRCAPSQSPAPMRWATCTEKPEAAALSSPPKSHVVVDTKPIAAEASAPRLPTIDASIYCITIDDNCATTAGTLSITAKRTFCPADIVRPSRIIASNLSASVFILIIQSAKLIKISGPVFWHQSAPAFQAS